ncbi:MATE family efflux transporter [Saccharibacillus alkalitolerans]|uniref:Probable multidrug resistance protein NorM n=1 Tax=Saccharibacillus alkalitolerans TaxID=2705290 RepID=A0ABX0F902_9BACL|nr:MATE family efflux transporter [Saccharibacillus alkalitolerans]NGZ76910.1 MATE family efflux transporter [Saccharibacillus alkalitolerans]
MFRKISIKNKNNLNLITSMALPLMATQFFQIIFQITDQAIVGRLKVEDFAAVGVASSFIFLITGTIGMLCSAFNIIGGQYFGKNNIEKFGESFNVTISISVIIGILCEIFILSYGKNIMQIIYGLNPETLTVVKEYLNIAGLTIGINLILFSFSAYFKNIKKSHILVYSLTAASIVNVCVDYILVYGEFGFPKLGAKGAAIGSVVGYTVSLVLSMFFFNKYKIFNYSFILKKEVLYRLFRLYIPLALQDLIEYTFFAIAIMAFITRLDVHSLAGYTVISTLTELFMIPMYALSGVCMTLSAQSYGKDKKGTDYTRLSCTFLLGLLAPLALVMIVFSLPIARMITDKESIILIVHQMLPVALLSSTINGVQMILRSTLQAIDLEKWVLVYSTFICSVSLVIIYLMIEYFKLPGLYSGLGICYLVLSLGYILKIKNKSRKPIPIQTN